MATLAVWRFDAPEGAERAASRLAEIADQGPVVVHDAATVEWQLGRTKPRTHQVPEVSATSALGAAFWGTLFGLAFFVPLLGVAIGATSSALAGSLSDVGIDDAFINRLRDMVTPGTSALFVLSPDVGSDMTTSQLDDVFPDSTELLTTTLTSEQEQALRTVFTDDVTK